MKYLIVVDMQNDFIYGALGNKECQAIVTSVVEKVKNFDGTIIFTQDTHTEDYPSTQEGKYLPVVHCIKGSDGWEIIPELKEYAENTVTKKTFGSIELAGMLKEKENEITSIELVGVCTSICVISNALVCKAYMTEVPISVDATCCACVTPESHEAAIKAMEMSQIKIIHS